MVSDSNATRKKKDFALILPWETFYDKQDKEKTKIIRHCPLKKYQTIFGGKYSCFDLQGDEKNFWSPDLNKYKIIGCKILYWQF